MELTKCDKETLALCPAGWFVADDLWPRVKRADYRCGRLVEAGVLERTVVGPSYEDLHSEYRVAPQEAVESGEKQQATGQSGH